jgi:uncharacterized membrane protein
MMPKLAFAAVAALSLAACRSEATDKAVAEDAAKDTYNAEVAGDAARPDADSTLAYDGIVEDEKLHFTGTEPFWGGDVTGRTLTWKTPENQIGDVIEIERFAGRGGISFSGLLTGEEFIMTVTPLECSDGMSDRTYPFTVTVKIGKDTRNGCGWTDRQPMTEPAKP